MRTALTAVGWVVVVLLLLVGLDVWLGPARTPLVLAAGLAPWLLLAAWPVAITAALTRHWALAAAGVALVVVHVFVVLPSFAPWHSPPPAVPTGAFTVYDQNVKYDNTDLTGVARQIRAADADVVVLEELANGNWPSLDRTGAVDPYPHRALFLQGGARGYGVFSRLPLANVSLWTASNVQNVRATVTAPDGRAITLFTVHTNAPVGGAARRWSAEMAAIAQRARDEPGPLIVVGDFNATMAMKQMRWVLSAHLRDAAAANGEGWRMTWPAEGHAVGPIMRIDHALFSPGLTITQYRLAGGAGSDHKAMRFTVGRAS